MFTMMKEAKPQCRRPSRLKAQLILGDVRGGRPFPIQGGTQGNTKDKIQKARC